MRTAIAITLLTASLTAGCKGGSGDMPVPRRTAYPRMQVLDTVMRSAEIMPGRRVRVNAGATVSSPRPGWLDVAYPGYGAVMHVTLTEVVDANTLAEVKANRMERLVLNAGGLPGVQSEWTTPAGLQVMTLRTDGSSTPLQFLATDDSTYVLSGAVYFSDQSATTAIDSIAPLVDAIDGDIKRMFNDRD